MTVETKLSASNPNTGDYFGWATAVDGDTVVIGALGADGVGPDSGAAYVYAPDGSGSDAETILSASDAESYDWFGYSASVSGDTIVVGAPHKGAIDRAGAAYVFVRDGSGGHVETKLTATDADEIDLFGQAVAVSDDLVVVGSPLDDENGSASGSVYVFERDGAGGFTETKLVADDGAADDQFGRAVAVSGDTIVVGADSDDDNGPNSGSAYVFERDGSGGFTETKIAASDGTQNDEFGESVAVSGDTIVVGADGPSGGATETGWAYVYDRNSSGGFTETKLTASDAAPDDGFGGSVAVSADTIVVGAPRDDDNGQISGSVYTFKRDGSGGFTETKLIASDGARSDLLGSAVAVSGDTVVAGAYNTDSKTGSVYLFSQALDSDDDGIIDGADNCPDDVNADQADADGDESGDVCDTDDDNDGVADVDDVFPLDPNESGDADGDGEGDNADTDDDNDGVADVDDICADTVLPDEPTRRLLRWRYAASVDGFASTGGVVKYTLEDTAGCSGAQITDALHLHKVNKKYGISKPSLMFWVWLVRWF